MPWHSRDCQAALVSELHWLHRGQQKDCPFTAHPPGLIYLTALSLQRHDYVVWAENSSVVTSNPIWAQQSVCLGLVGVFPRVWVLLRRISRFKYALDLNAPTLSRSCSVKDEHLASFFCCRCLMQLLVVSLSVTRNGLIERKVGGGDEGVLPTVNRITGSSQHHGSPLFTVCSGSECFPHLHCCTVTQWVLGCDVVARVMADGTYAMVVH